jgi:hypothetical protein
VKASAPVAPPDGKANSTRKCDVVDGLSIDDLISSTVFTLGIYK